MQDAIIQSLIERGVKIPHPSCTHIDPDVDITRISPGVVLHAGTSLKGAGTYVMPGAVLGQEGPVTLDDCRLGPGVALKGGYFQRSVFLDKANFALGAHVREACLIEEEAGGAHTVGLKQTILMPFVTLGSLINFCDCMMAGGTSRQDHSEVGSSYIHFNYTPNQDKATASLMGDVARGVMLRQRPIFLGGQGGLVGPSRIGFGCVIAAGVVFRGELAEGMLAAGAGKVSARQMPFSAGIYREIQQRLRNNVNYIANLLALRQWYQQVRVHFLDREMLQGALDVLASALDERIKRLGGLAGKMTASIEGLRREGRGEQDALCRRQNEFRMQWPAMQEKLVSLEDYQGEARLRDAMLSALTRQNSDYISAIKTLEPGAVEQGTQWLAGIVDTVNREVLALIPTYA